MTGKEFRLIRERWELGRTDTALLLGYIGTDRNNNLRIRRLEDEELVPLYIARLVWLIDQYRNEHGHLPYWPNGLKIEGEKEPWM